MTASQVISPNLLAEEAESQLQRIASSAAFAKSERLSRFLIFTVRATLEGNSSIVKESVLALEVFDRDASYDSRVDSVVRVQASRLRVKLKEYYEREGMNDPVEISYPRGTYVPVFRTRDVAVSTREPEQAEVPVTVPPRHRRRFLAYAALWILSVLLGHLLINAASNLLPRPKQHSATHIVTAEQAALVTSRNFTAIQGVD